MKFARVVFVTAGLYGLVTLIPLYFLEARIGLNDPPAITHPEYFYGFVGVALACQALFLLIASAPDRYRPVMLVAFLEKFGFAGATIALFVAQRIHGQVLALGLVDLTFGILFLAAFAMTPHMAFDARQASC